MKALKRRTGSSLKAEASPYGWLWGRELPGSGRAWVGAQGEGLAALKTVEASVLGHGRLTLPPTWMTLRSSLQMRPQPTDILRPQTEEPEELFLGS